MFEPLPAKFDFPRAERDVLEFWQRHDVFRRSLEQRLGAPPFVFYEGPPTANGMPHPGHCLTRAMKDIFPRYRTMCGYQVERKAGWDTHGLPVEREVCKELGIRTKQEIEAYGVEKFIFKCIESVFRYTREWEEMTRRLGFWVNLEDAYVTFHQSYVESVWWSLKTLFERGVLYQGHKVVWWWAQGGTALSSGEVGEGYRTVDDPSVYVKFPLIATDRHPPRTSLLVWTTTPWTLISNHFAAVHPDLEYALVHDAVDDEYLYVAAALVETIAKKVKRELKVVKPCAGRDLRDLRYLPPFLEIYDAPARAGSGEGGGRGPLGAIVAARVGGGQAHIGWRVLEADFVTIESGTGLVHEAPAFGEVDFNLLQAERQRFADRDAIPVICAVAPDGTFTADAPERYRGRWVKDCDKEIVRELRDERKTPWGTPLLYHQEQVRHDYPFCPQAPDDPLIQYARQSWFVRTSQVKDEFLRNNALVNWLPEHIKEGRFGDFLRNNVDWALSRERYWGTPLPIWRCETCGRMEAIGSFDELKGKPGATDGGYWERKVAEHRAAGDPPLPDHLRVHKPYVDEWTYACGCASAPAGRGSTNSGGISSARMRRVREVIDCWWDAGSMPFAQWGFPHAPGSIERVRGRWPADFISEAIDQTRGWFYGLLAISTLVREDIRKLAGAAGSYPLPFKTCIVLGHILGEDGNKMSKKLRNYKEPTYIFDTYGADAMRWYFFSVQAPWTSVRFQEEAIRDSQREFLIKLYNVLSFFCIYANIDGFVAAAPRRDAGPTGWRPVAQRAELDRWILSELHRTIRFVREKMDAFENFPAAGRLNDFVDALSNWYVRRSRDRFWRAVAGGAGGADPSNQDKWDAYNTLYESLLTLSRLIAPFTPFFAETMFQTLTGNANAGAADAPRAATAHSVHLGDYPAVDAALLDEELAQEMDLVRQIVSTGRAARTAAKLKVRQPLDQVEIILSRREHEQWLDAHRALIAEELNVKNVEFTAEADHYVTYQIKADFKAIGPKFGKLAPRIAAALGGVDAAAARRQLDGSGNFTVQVDGAPVQLTEQEVQVRLEAKPGWSAAQGRAGVVVVKTELTQALIEEGLIRELIHHVQAARKDLDLPYDARIDLTVDGGTTLNPIVQRFAESLRSECLVERLDLAVPKAELREVTVEDHTVRFAIARR